MKLRPPLAILLAAVVIPASSAGATFAPAVGFSAGFGGSGAGAGSIAAADLYGDGHLDLAVANQLLGGVSILRGEGDGTFAAPVFYVTGAGAGGVATGDFDGDGNVDLAVVNTVAGTVTILLNRGDGRFENAGSYAVGLAPQQVVAADFNGDGRADLAVVDPGSASVAGTVQLLINTGGGRFTAGATLPAGETPGSVAVADLNHDGVPDLVVGSALLGHQVTVFIGKGDGEFSSGTTYQTGESVEDVAVANVDGDGIPDIVTANLASGTISLLDGHGDGTFAPAQSIPAGPGPDAVAVADLDGDGVPELIVTDALTLPGGEVRVIGRQAGGGFRTVQLESIPALSPQAVIAARLVGGDGCPDLAISTQLSSDVYVLNNRERCSAAIAPPRLGNLRISPRRFRARRRGPSIANRGPARISYMLSDRGVTSFEIAGIGPGARSTPSGSFIRRATAGRNAFGFSGRVDGRALRPGGYVLRAVARSAGQTSLPVTVRFQIVR